MKFEFLIFEDREKKSYLINIFIILNHWSIGIDRHEMEIMLIFVDLKNHINLRIFFSFFLIKFRLIGIKSLEWVLVNNGDVSFYMTRRIKCAG